MNRQMIACLLVSAAAYAPDAEAQGAAEKASPAELVPARFAGGTEAAAARIDFPDYKKDLALFVYCVAGVRPDATLRYNYCLDYYGAGDDDFRKEVEGVVPTLAFTAASANGDPVQSELYYRVFFGKQDDKYAVGVYANWGDDADTLGLEYEGPQRYGEKPRGDTCNTSAAISKIAVDTTGTTASELKFTLSYSEREKLSPCEQWGKQTAEHGTYIPARRDGEPVGATHTEVWGDPQWITLRRPKGS